MKALLVIDMLNDFIYGRENLLINVRDRKSFIRNLESAVAMARKKKIPVIFSNCSHTMRHPCVKLTGRHAMMGTKAAQVIPELKPKRGDYVVGKISFDGFYKTRLESLLKRLKLDELYITGVQTDCCIRETAISAGYRGFKVLVVKNCCATNAKWKSEGAFHFLKNNVGKIVDRF